MNELKKEIRELKDEIRNLRKLIEKHNNPIYPTYPQPYVPDYSTYPDIGDPSIWWTYTGDAEISWINPATGKWEPIE